MKIKKTDLGLYFSLNELIAIFLYKFHDHKFYINILKIDNVTRMTVHILTLSGTKVLIDVRHSFLY
jgi:hypothetical protein